MIYKWGQREHSIIIFYSSLTATSKESVYYCKPKSEHEESIKQLERQMQPLRKFKMRVGVVTVQGSKAIETGTVNMTRGKPLEIMLNEDAGTRIPRFHLHPSPRSKEPKCNTHLKLEQG